MVEENFGRGDGNVGCGVRMEFVSFKVLNSSVGFIEIKGFYSIFES